MGASPLTDDTGLTPVALTAGESVSVPVTAAGTSLYTVTAAAPVTASWRAVLRSADGTVVHAVEERDAAFTWAGQTRVFRFAGGVTGGTLAFEAATPVVLTQLQLIAADGTVTDGTDVH